MFATGRRVLGLTCAAALLAGCMTGDDSVPDALRADPPASAGVDVEHGAVVPGTAAAAPVDVPITDPGTLDTTIVDLGTADAGTIDPASSAGAPVQDPTGDVADVPGAGGGVDGVDTAGGGVAGGDELGSGAPGDVGGGDDPVLEPPSGGNPTDDIPLSEYAMVSDDTGTIVVEVPPTWVDVDGSAPIDADAQLTVSTDVDAFVSSYATPGLAVTASATTPGATMWEDLLATASDDAEAAGCDLADEGGYDDGLYSGVERTFSCAGAPLVVSLIAGTNEDGTTAWLLRLITDDGDEASRQRVFHSFLVD